MKRFPIALMLTVLAAPGAAAQDIDLDFGGWCAEVAHFNAERCAEARPEDKQAYERYAEKIELFYNEVYKRDEARRLEIERVNRMGDVTHDQTRDPYSD